MKKFIFLLFFSMAAMAQDYGIVKDVRPLYRVINTPIESCEEYKRSNSSLNIGTVVGGLAGGLIGNQIGTNGTNAVATFIGTGVGAIIGQKAASRNYSETRCTTTYRTQNKLTNYKVDINYKGSTVSTILNYRPIVGTQIPVNKEMLGE